MSVKAQLSAQPREKTGKGANRRLRDDGRVPGVVYGGGTETVTVSLDHAEAKRLFQQISVENTLVDLKIGDGKPVSTLVREIQAHPYKPELIHVDFYVITAGQAIEVQIPIHLNGTPEGVKESGGVLEQIVHELPVKCTPDQIPETLEIDVTELGMNEAIHVADVDLGPEVEVLIDTDRTICTVVAPKVVAEPEPEEAEVDLELIGEEGEVLEEGVEVEEGEAAEEEETAAEE